MKDKNAQRFRERLIELRDRLLSEARSSAEEITGAGQSPGDLSHVPTHSADRDSEGLTSELGVEANRERILDAVDTNLGRIADGTYGRCVDCEKEIPNIRLEAIPYASRCVPCEEKWERAEQAG